MPERLRSLATKLRAFVGNRRHARRFDVRLDVEILLQEVHNGKIKIVRAPPVSGITRDISADGLSLVVPSIRVEEH